MEVKNMLLEIERKVILVTKWQRTQLNFMENRIYE